MNRITFANSYNANYFRDDKQNRFAQIGYYIFRVTIILLQTETISASDQRERDVDIVLNARA